MVAASYYPRRVNLRVPNMQYAAEINLGAPYVCNFGAPLALSTTYFASAATMVNGSAVTLQVSDGTILNNGLVPGTSASVPTLWGRGLTLVASSTNTRAVTITGYDYLGQKLVRTSTMTSGTPIAIAAAFMWVESIVFASASDTTTVDVGYNNVFGLPFKGMQMTNEVKNEAAAANAGTFTAGLVSTTTPTATTADVRGTYLPSTVLPDGTNRFQITYFPDYSQLHGSAQYSG